MQPEPTNQLIYLLKKNPHNRDSLEIKQIELISFKRFYKINCLAYSAIFTIWKQIFNSFLFSVKYAQQYTRHI